MLKGSVLRYLQGQDVLDACKESRRAIVVASAIRAEGRGFDRVDLKTLFLDFSLDF